MKKSFDYFKTLKFLSECVSGAFTATVSSGDFEAFRLSFLGEKSSLLNNLQTEFITPFERGDIFILTDSLSNELDCISTLNGYSSLFFNDCFQFSDSLKMCFKKQNEIFSFLGGGLKSLNRLCVLCHEAKCDVLSEQRKIQQKVRAIISCTESQPLIKYAVYAVFLDLTRSLKEGFSEIERIIINNG